MKSMLFGGIVSCPLGWNEGAGTPLLALGPLALGPLAVFGRWESSRFLSTESKKGSLLTLDASENFIVVSLNQHLRQNAKRRNKV
jgi:hypothetical protein